MYMQNNCNQVIYDKLNELCPVILKIYSTDFQIYALHT